MRPLIFCVIGVCLVAFNPLLNPASVWGEAIEGDGRAECKELLEEISEMGVRDSKVLEAIGRVHRSKFVPRYLRPLACLNQPLPIGEGQTISQPYIVAFMTEALALKPADRVLEIGTGSGYQAAVLGELVEEVFSIEIIEKLAIDATKLLQELGYKNISVKTGDGHQGWPEKAPFDAIIVTAAPREIPKTLVEQLAEGGRMILPLGADKWSQELILLTKKEGKIQQKRLIPVIFVPMTGKAKQ